jgi:hypothetical protein
MSHGNESAENKFSLFKKKMEKKLERKKILF